MVSPVQCFSSVLAATSLFVFGGCKTSDFADQPPPADYPPPIIPVPEAPPALAPKPVSRPSSVGSSIRPGDSLELFVEEDDAFNGTYPVREQGDIIIPSVGRIQVAGLSVGSAGARVKTELEARHLKKATVILDRVGRAESPRESAAVVQSPAAPAAPKLTIYLDGKVKRPGQHKIDLPKTGRLGVYEAILIAGGLSNFADPARVHLLRNDAQGRKRRIPVNITNIEKGLEADPAIGDGDIVVVPEKVFGF
jgi:protein involved in polysaccharide export with SLBB domain